MSARDLEPTWRFAAWRAGTAAGGNGRAIVAACVLAAGIACAVLAPRVAPFEPLAQNLEACLRPPSAENWLGTDALGRDVLSRLLYGARVSFGVGALATWLALLVGAAAGAIAGFGGAAIDTAISRVTEVFLAFPGLLLAIALAAALGPSPARVALALALMGWPVYARLVRAEVRSVARRDFVTASAALGASRFRLQTRHLLPAAAPALAVQSAFGLSGAIVAEASLSFLGLGSPPPSPSWGAMLAEGRSFLVVAPHLAIAPAAVLAATIVSIQILGDALAQRWQRGQ